MNQFWLHSVGNIHVIYPKKIDKHERERKRLTIFFFFKNTIAVFDVRYFFVTFFNFISNALDY